MPQKRALDELPASMKQLKDILVKQGLPVNSENILKVTSDPECRQIRTRAFSALTSGLKDHPGRVQEYKQVIVCKFRKILPLVSRLWSTMVERFASRDLRLEIFV